MWRSFGQGAGGPMGGGSGGGGLMRTVHRAVRAGTGGHGSSEEPFSRSTTTHNSSTTSPTSRPSYKPSSSDYNSNTLSISSVNHPNWADSSPTCGGDYVGVDGFYDDYVFCTVPSTDEVDDAISSLQQVLDPPTSSHDSGWELDWIEPSRSMLHSRGSESVYDAFHLLQTEPSVKKMVISLSSDKSVWDAVMNNEAVRELRDSVQEANKNIIENSGKVENSDGTFPVSEILDWVFINIKAKVMEIIEKITETVNTLFQSPRNEKDKEKDATTEPLEKKIRSSFLLSVMVLLVVIISRVNKS